MVKAKAKPRTSARAVKAKAAVRKAIKAKAASRATAKEKTTAAAKAKLAATLKAAVKATTAVKAKTAKPTAKRASTVKVATKKTASAKGATTAAKPRPTTPGTAKPQTKTAKPTTTRGKHPTTSKATTTQVSHSHPFPFLGSGAMPYDEVARIVIWFRDPTSVQTRADVLSALPTHFGAFGPDRTAALILETTEDLLTAFAEDVAKRKQFDTSIGQALLQIHARHPVVFAARVSLMEADEHGEQQPFQPDVWHAWSVTQATKILDVIEADRDVPAAIIATALGGHLDAKNEARARLHLLERLTPLMTSGDVASEDTELFAALLIETDVAQRALLVAPVAPRIRISLANEHSDLFTAFVDAPDAMAVIDHLADTKTDDAWTDDSASETARANAHRVRWLIDRLTSIAITDEKRRDTALEIAEAAISVANELSPQGESWTASRMLTVKSLQTELAVALTYLDAAARDKDGAHAIGIALAVAAKHSHRPMIDACVALALRNPVIVEDRAVVSNLLGELVGKSRFADAATLALAYLQQARDDDGSWKRHTLTPALVTNIVLAFAHTSERGPLASAFLVHATHLVEEAHGAYFAPDGGNDVRGSAHAWIALWHVAGGNIVDAVKHFGFARDMAYADLAIMRNNPIVHAHLDNPALAGVFSGTEDSSIREKTAQMKKNPRDWWATFSRGLLYHERGDLPRALVDYDKTIKLNPNYADVYVNIGNIHWTRDNNHAEAIRWYDKALARADKLFLGRLNRAEARLHTKAFAGSIEDAKIALGVQPSAHAHFLLALAHAALGDKSAAKKSARAGAKLAPDIVSIDVPAWKEQLRALL